MTAMNSRPPGIRYSQYRRELNPTDLLVRGGGCCVVIVVPGVVGAPTGPSWAATRPLTSAMSDMCRSVPKNGPGGRSTVPPPHATSLVLGTGSAGLDGRNALLVGAR